MSFFRRRFAVLLLLHAATTVTHAQSLGFLELPEATHDYVGYAVDRLPAHFGDGGILTATSGDNTPTDNPITNAGATLGRVLFYDKRLSHDNSRSCASCHHQSLGFSDNQRLSDGIGDTKTKRHSMSLTNTKFYANDRFFRDESAQSLEEQVLMPIVDPIELGSNMNELLAELAETDYYAELFHNAFGSPEITPDGMSKAMSQFVRSMVSYQSKYDSAFDDHGVAHFDDVLSEQEDLGRRLFHGVGRCSFCHTSEAQVATQPHNNGLDAVTDDPGVGDAAFKSASLRNVGVRAFFMHDGRFRSLREVVDFYSDEIQAHPELDFRLRDSSNDGAPVQLGLSEEEKDALVAFLETLTDYEFLKDPKFANPFALPCDFDGDENCTVDDLNVMLAMGDLNAGIRLASDGEPSPLDLIAFDLNDDAFVDNRDIAEWLNIAATANGKNEYQVGDADLNGVVDEADHRALNTNLFQQADTWDAGDFNGDGQVDGTDFNLWNTSFKNQAENSTVPEPYGRVYLWCSCLAYVAIRRRLN